MKLKPRGYNFKYIERDAESDIEIMLYTYAAIFSGTRLAHNRIRLLEKLHISQMPLGFYMPAIYETRSGLISNYLAGDQINFTNPEIFTEKIPVDIKVNYIRLTSLVTNEQRWLHKLWGNPIEIPLEIIENVDTRIPKTWIKRNNKKLQMIKEEQYYGKKVGRN